MPELSASWTTRGRNVYGHWLVFMSANAEWHGQLKHRPLTPGGQLRLQAVCHQAGGGGVASVPSSCTARHRSRQRPHLRLAPASPSAAPASATTGSGRAPWPQWLGAVGPERGQLGQHRQRQVQSVRGTADQRQVDASPRRNLVASKFATTFSS